MRNNCSSDREKLLKFEAEGPDFAKNFRSLAQFIRTVKPIGKKKSLGSRNMQEKRKGQNNIWKRTFFTKKYTNGFCIGQIKVQIETKSWNVVKNLEIKTWLIFALSKRNSVLKR